MLDVDDFKKINDTKGHLTGDGVLTEVAQRICRTIRTYDTVGRYGGGEFLIILPDCDLNQAQQTAKRIRAAVAGAPILALGSTTNATVSIGGAVAEGQSNSAKEILSFSDGALYSAKAAGKNCVAVHKFLAGTAKRELSL